MKLTFVFLLLILGMVFAMPVIAAPPGEPIAVAMEQTLYVSPLSAVFTTSPQVAFPGSPTAFDFVYTKASTEVLSFAALAVLAGLSAMAGLPTNVSTLLKRKRGHGRARDQPVLLC